MLKGPTALAWARDPVAVSKVCVEFAKTNEKLVLIGGALGAQTLDASGVKALSELPSLDTLRAGSAGDAQYPCHPDRKRRRGAGGQSRASIGGLCQEGRGGCRSSLT